MKNALLLVDSEILPTLRKVLTSSCSFHIFSVVFSDFSANFLGHGGLGKENTFYETVHEAVASSRKMTLAGSMADMSRDKCAYCLVGSFVVFVVNSTFSKCTCRAGCWARCRCRTVGSIQDPPKPHFA